MACFVKSVSRETIKDLELGNPFLRMKIFPLTGVESKALTLQDVPQHYRPYPGCIFDVLSEPDNVKRKQNLTKFFKNLCARNCPTRKYGLLYTIMQCWKAGFATAMNHPPHSEHIRTFEWLMSTGMFRCFLHVLTLCLNPDFLAAEYNRYVPHRILETFFVSLQSEVLCGDDVVKKIIIDLDEAVSTFQALMEGKITFLEQVLAQQVAGNFSCYPSGMIFLFEHPKLSSVTGRYLWKAFDYAWTDYFQYSDRKMHHHRHQMNTDIPLLPVGRLYLPGTYRLPELCAYSALCCMCNICAGFPEECGMDKVDACLISLVEEGFYWNLGNAAMGIHISFGTYEQLSIDKFLSLTSWSCFNALNQKRVLRQFKSLPYSRKEDPLMFFPSSKYKGRSVIAFLITHALWLDFDRGTHFSVLGLIHLLRENTTAAKIIIEAVGPEMFDLGQSIHHVQLPGDGDPVSIKRGLFEPMLKISGQSHYTEQGDYVYCRNDNMYPNGDYPQGVREVSSYCMRHVKELKIDKAIKLNMVKKADQLKVEGNSFYSRGELTTAIECYSRALDICPLACTERRVTYHSNRAECYLQTNQPRQAIRDCCKALAMNPLNMKVRWRRSQAFQKVGYNYPAALDLITMHSKESESLKVLGKKTFQDLQRNIIDLLNHSSFRNCAAYKYATLIHNDTVQRTASVVPDELERSNIPPFRGKTYADLFGRSAPRFNYRVELKDDAGTDKKKDEVLVLPSFGLKDAAKKKMKEEKKEAVEVEVEEAVEEEGEVEEAVEEEGEVEVEVVEKKEEVEEEEETKEEEGAKEEEGNEVKDEGDKEREREEREMRMRDWDLEEEELCMREREYFRMKWEYRKFRGSRGMSEMEADREMMELAMMERMLRERRMYFEKRWKERARREKGGRELSMEEGEEGGGAKDGEGGGKGEGKVRDDGEEEGEEEAIEEGLRKEEDKEDFEKDEKEEEEDREKEEEGEEEEEEEEEGEEEEEEGETHYHSNYHNGKEERDIDGPDF